MKRKRFLKLTALAPISLAMNRLDFLAPQPNKNISRVEFLYPGNEQYRLLNIGFNKRVKKNPAVIARCFNTEGVAEAIQYARKNKLAVAVKSGGHCMEGFSSNNNGLVINLSELNQIKWIDQNTIQVGPACTLKKLYETILPKKKIIPGGSCATVGIGGLTLGGGYGLLARKYGLTCDSLVGISMVDGRGNILTEKNSNELLWAAKGGNNGNFGVITSLTFKLHQAPATMQSHRFRSFKVDAARAKLILKKWFDITQALPVNCFSAFVLNKTTLYILLTNAGSHTNEVQKVIVSLSAISEKTTHSQPAPIEVALKNYYGRQEPMYFKNASAGLYKSFSSIESHIESALKIVTETPGMIYQVNTLGGNIQSAEFAGAAAFPHRDYGYFSELQTYWERQDQETLLLKKFQQVQEVFNAAGMDAQYRNYPDINFKNWQTLYYGKNYERLQQLKKQYDPENIFRYEQSVRVS